MFLGNEQEELRNALVSEEKEGIDHDTFIWNMNNGKFFKIKNWQQIRKKVKYLK